MFNIVFFACKKCVKRPISYIIIDKCKNCFKEISGHLKSYYSQTQTQLNDTNKVCASLGMGYLI